MENSKGIRLLEIQPAALGPNPPAWANGPGTLAVIEDELPAGTTCCTKYFLSFGLDFNSCSLGCCSDDGLLTGLGLGLLEPLPFSCIAGSLMAIRLPALPLH